MSDTLHPYGLYLTELFCPWDYPRQNTGSGLIFPPPGDLLDPGFKPMSPVAPDWQLDSLPPGNADNKRWIDKWIGGWTDVLTCDNVSTANVGSLGDEFRVACQMLSVSH